MSASEEVWAGFSDEDFLGCMSAKKYDEDRKLNVQSKRSIEIGLQGTSAINTLARRFSVSKKRRPNNKDIPLYQYRYGRLWVTHLVQQFWCEQQVHYDFEPPLELIGEEIEEPTQVTVGASIHLARELEIQDIVEVKVESREDRFAVKLSNLLSAIHGLLLQGRTVLREIPVFGLPFDMGVFVIGTIDEIRCDQESLSLTVVELKTRRSNCLPTSSQTMTHQLQLMLYKRLFDEMVSGKLTKAIISKHMKLNMTRVLGKDVLKHLQDSSLNTLSKLMDSLLNLLQAVPFISKLLLEYVFQETESVIGNLSVTYDDDWLNSKLTRAFGYWKGERSAVGVDIEDAWKCSFCPYSIACNWKANLDQQLAALAIKAKAEEGSHEGGTTDEKNNNITRPLTDDVDVEANETVGPQADSQKCLRDV